MESSEPQSLTDMGEKTWQNDNSNVNDNNNDKYLAKPGAMTEATADLVLPSFRIDHPQEASHL